MQIEISRRKKEKKKAEIIERTMRLIAQRARRRNCPTGEHVSFLNLISLFQRNFTISSTSNCNHPQSSLLYIIVSLHSN